MFTLKFKLFQPPDPIPPPVPDANAVIKIKDHSYLKNHLESLGIKLEDLNFFKWQAFPNRSYGKFIVSEAEWSALNAPKGNIKADLTIQDQNNTKVFYNLEVVRTSFLMSPIFSAAQDGSRLLVIELEHTADKYHSMNRVFGRSNTVQDLGELTVAPPGTPLIDMGEIMNAHTMPDVPITEYLAYIAASQFLTAYLPSGTPGVENVSYTTKEKFSFPSNMQLLYSNVSTIATPLRYVVKVRTSDSCIGSFCTSNEITITPSETIYNSAVNSNTNRQNIELIVPHAFVNHVKASLEYNHCVNEATRIATKIKPYAETRLLRNIDVIYQGLVPGDITNDVQCITYFFQGNEYGMRTRLQSIPWEPYNSILGIIEPTTNENIFRGVLLSNMPNAQAAIFRLADATEANKFIQSYSTTLKDRLGVFGTLKAGSKVLVYRDSINCSYHVIQSVCPGNPPPSAPLGKCCVLATLPGAGNYLKSFCYQTTEDVCNALGGWQWISGSTCPSPPYCED